MQIKTKEEFDILKEVLQDLRYIANDYNSPHDIISKYETILNKYNGIPEFKFPIHLTPKQVYKTSRNEE